MRISTAYFAGVGTVVVAVAAGLGGGYLAANITSPPLQTVSKLERRMSAEPIHVSTAPAEPVPQVAATTNAASAPPQEQPQTQPQQSQQTPQPQQQTEAAAPSVNNTRTEEKRAEEKTANNVAAAQPAQPPQPTKSAEQADEKTAAPRDVFARARDADIKRADIEKRRAERRQRWADRRRFQQPREQELEAVEGSVREVTEPRRIRIREEAEPREMFVAPARGEMPRIRLFDQDD
jgi:outer membrane biosynthesis protein TonB